MLDKPMAMLRSFVRTQVDTQPQWWTPHSWADTDGLFATKDQAWLFRQLPASHLRSAQLLDGVLAALGPLGAGRDVQFLMHTWQHVQDPAPGTPEALAAFQRDSMQFLVPTRAVAVGVRLRAGGPTSTTLGGGLTRDVHDAADRLLGEQVPQLDAYDADRAAVGAALDGAGAVLMSRRCADMVEAWYTLGVAEDTECVEKDDYLVFPRTSQQLELVAVNGVVGDVVNDMPAPSASGVNILSVRGTVRAHGAGAVLMNASALYGRLSDQAFAPWSVDLRPMVGVSTRPLPLRQLVALDETLPCSTRRISPTLQKVSGATLRTLGIADAAAPGAPAGLLVGTGGVDMSRPAMLDPFAGDRRCVVVGRGGAGKTFMAEGLAYQAHLAGFRVLFLSGEGGDSRFRQLSGAPSWAPANPGDLDPYRWLPPSLAAQVVARAVDVLQADLSDTERAGLAAGLRRAQQAQVGDLRSALQLSDSPSAVAKVLRAARTGPASLLLGAREATRASLPDQLHVDLRHLTGHPEVAALAMLVLISACAPDARATMVVADGLGDALARPGLSSAFQVMADAPTVALLTTATSAAQLPGPLRDASHRFLLSSSDPGDLRWLSTEPTPALLQWLDDAIPVVTGGAVAAAAAGLYSLQGRKVTGVQVGPWPEPVLQVLTAGNASIYAALR